MACVAQDLEPVLVDMFSSDDSVTGDSSDWDNIDALWCEVGELLEEVPLVTAVDAVDQRKDRKRIKANEEESCSKRRKEAVEDEIKREIRMARNRASAERTRLRRLEHIKNLEVELARIESANYKVAEFLKNKLGKTDQELMVEGVESTIQVPVVEPLRRKRNNKKKDASNLLQELEQKSAELSPEELARLQKETRMARNRASAERTRLRRLEAARKLEIQVSIARAVRSRYLDLLRADVDQLSRKDMDELGVYDELCAQSSSDEERAKPWVRHEVARNETLCKTGPAWFVLYKNLFSPQYLFLVTCKVSRNELVVLVQGGSIRFTNVRAEGRCNSFHKCVSFDLSCWASDFSLITFQIQSANLRPQLQQWSLFLQKRISILPAGHFF